MLALTFCVGPMQFALPSRSVVQVVPMVPLRQVAGLGGNGGTEMAGLLELGTRVVPVIDLGVQLRGTASAQRLSTRIIVVRTHHDGQPVELGLIAENVIDLCPLDDGESTPVRDASAPGAALGGLTRVRGALVQWIDVEQIVPPDARARIYQGIFAQSP